MYLNQNLYFLRYAKDLKQTNLEFDTNKNKRTLRGSVTFFEYLHYRLTLPRPIMPPKGYPVELQTLGDHIRKRRLDLGLLQMEVASEIGVSENTVWNWEHGTEPELRHIPAVLSFLGYMPWKCPDDPGGEACPLQEGKGLSLRRLGPLMGRDPEQLEDWLSGRHEPIERNKRMIEEFLNRRRAE